MKKPLAIIVIVALLAVAAFAFSALPERLQQEAEGQGVSMFFAHESNAGDYCGAVYPAGVRITIDRLPEDVAAFAVRELLSGPTAAETADGYFTSIPDGVALNNLSIGDDVVHIDVSSEIEAGGSCRVIAIRAQFERTVQALLGDSTSVIITVDGGNPDEALQP